VTITMSLASKGGPWAHGCSLIIRAAKVLKSIHYNGSAEVSQTARRQDSGFGIQEPGFGSRQSGINIQESGIRMRHSEGGARVQRLAHLPGITVLLTCPECSSCSFARNPRLAHLPGITVLLTCPECSSCSFARNPRLADFCLSEICNLKSAIFSRQPLSKAPKGSSLTFPARPATAGRSLLAGCRVHPRHEDVGGGG